MADTETKSFTVSNQPAHPDEKKGDEEMLATTQEGITPSQDDENNGDVEKVNLKSNVGPEAFGTKLEESPNNMSPEPPAKAEVEKLQIRDFHEAKSTGQEITPQVEIECHSECQGLTGEAAENKLDEAPATNDAIKESGDKHSTEAVPKETEGKASKEEVAIEQSEISTDSVEKVTEEKAPIQEATEEQKEISVEATIKKDPENTSAVHLMGNVPQEKLKAEPVESATDEKATEETIKSKMKENPDVNSSGNPDTSKLAMEEISTVVGKETGSAPAEQPTTEPVESILDEPAAVKKIQHETGEKLRVGGETQDQPATAEVDKLEPEKVDKKTKFEAEKTVELKRNTEEFKDNMVSSEEKLDASLVVKISAATSEEARPDQRAEEKPPVFEGDKASAEVTSTKEAVGADLTEQSLKDEAKLPGKVGEREVKNDEIEEDRDKTFRLGDLMQEDSSEAENAGSSEASPKVTKNSLEKEQASRDIEMNDEKAPNVVQAAPTSADTCKETNGGNAETATKEKNAQSEVKTEKKVEADTNRLETKKESNNETKSDINAMKESNENVDIGKECQDMSAKQVSGKPSQKPSNNILSKVKKSIVKMKKALVGKSPSSRNITAEA